MTEFEEKMKDVANQFLQVDTKIHEEVVDPNHEESIIDSNDMNIIANSSKVLDTGTIGAILEYMY